MSSWADWPKFHRRCSSPVSIASSIVPPPLPHTAPLKRAKRAILAWLRTPASSSFRHQRTVNGRRAAESGKLPLRGGKGFPPLLSFRAEMASTVASTAAAAAASTAAAPSASRSSTLAGAPVRVTRARRGTAAAGRSAGRQSRVVITRAAAAVENGDKPFAAWDLPPSIPNRTDIKTIMVIGAGPIVIGQVRRPRPPR